MFGLCGPKIPTSRTRLPGHYSNRSLPFEFRLQRRQRAPNAQSFSRLASRPEATPASDNSSGVDSSLASGQQVGPQSEPNPVEKLSYSYDFGIWLRLYFFPFRLLKIGRRIYWKMSSEALQAANVYRHLLKTVKKHIAKEDTKKHFVEYVTREFRENGNLKDLTSIQERIKLARDYTFLIDSVHHQKELLFSYNIAVDRSEEMKRILGKSAQSVGLRLPEVYEP